MITKKQSDALLQEIYKQVQILQENGVSEKEFVYQITKNIKER